MINYFMGDFVVALSTVCHSQWCSITHFFLEKNKITTNTVDCGNRVFSYNLLNQWIKCCVTFFSWKLIHFSRSQQMCSREK